MSFTTEEEKTITTGFYVSVMLKAVISVAEIAVGVLALFVPVSAVKEVIVSLPLGPAANLVESLLDELMHVSGVFIALYLLSRGLVKVLLIAGMLKNQLWAYPASLVVMGSFLVYQLHQIFAAHSWAIVALTVFDLVVMWFIWEEYKVVKNNTKV